LYAFQICYDRPKRINVRTAILPDSDYVTFGSLLSQIRLSSVWLSSCNIPAFYSWG